MISSPNLTTLLIVILGGASVSAFVTPNKNFNTYNSKWGIQIETQTPGPSSVQLYAQKKKRRRRKQPPAGTGTGTPTTGTQSASLDEEDELPDFELIEDIDLAEMEAAKQPMASPLAAASVSRKEINFDDPEVLKAMRSTNVPNTGMAGSEGSTKDLLRSRNRDLENRLVVNVIKEDVPSLAEYTQQGKKPRNSPDFGTAVDGGAQMQNLGKKAAKREARRAAALERQPAIVEEEESFLDKLPFADKLPFGNKSDSNEPKEEKSLIKLLEEGTWACIYALVAWEVYINSPLFQRQAPLAPVVFSDPMTMTFLF